MQLLDPKNLNRFTGQRNNSYIKLIAMGVRWYDPAIGRFTQPDTIIPDSSAPIAFDRYHYAKNNPLIFIDPTGHSACQPKQCGYTHDYDSNDDKGNWSPLADLLVQRLLGNWWAVVEGESFNDHPDYDPDEDQLLQDAQESIAEDGNFYGLWGSDIADTRRQYSLWRTGQDPELFWEFAGQALTEFGMGFAANLPQFIRFQADAQAYKYWSSATFSSAEKSLEYHYQKHGGPWGSDRAYTQAALDFYNSNLNVAKPHELRTGEMGIKITTGEYYGIYTTDGLIVSFGER